TNGSVRHAEMTAEALGILEHFDYIFDIVAADYVPKPAQATYDNFAALKRVETNKAAMFEVILLLQLARLFPLHLKECRNIGGHVLVDLCE
ncbi:hypothetical protein ACC698_37615, partial [Rhizobium johnstonii]